MNCSAIFLFLGWGSLIGILAFSLIVTALLRSGIAWQTRKDGTLSKESFKKFSDMLPSLGLILGFFLFLLGMSRRFLIPPVSFWPLFWTNFSLYSLLFLYDTLVIDYLVLMVWRPGFLRIPDSVTSQSMGKHIRVSIPIGLLFGALMCLGVAGVYQALWR